MKTNDEQTKKEQIMTKTNGNQTAVDPAAEYLSHIQAEEPQVVPVKVPSGFTFYFQKPSKFAMLFRSGTLPQSAASTAVEIWRAKGLIPPDMELTDTEENQIKIAQTAFDLVDRVLELSRAPKLVLGPALNPGELSAESVADDDMSFLFQWCASGGDAAQVAAKFSQGPGQRPLASANRKKRSRKVQQAGGA